MDTNSWFCSNSLSFYICVAAIWMSLLMAKMWIVPLSELHAMYFDTGSNEMQKTSAWSVPLLTSCNLVPVSVSNILTKVPYIIQMLYNAMNVTLSDAVASRFPSAFNVMAATED
ncbi:MAG: hypothetical protein ACMG6E_10545 [Candidatus Roizmanbacteria bacterium]